MMRRTVFGSVVVVAALLVPTSASAANSTVVSRFGVPKPFAFHVDSTSCGTGPFTGAARHLNGPATPRLGTASLHVTVGKDSAADLTAAVSADNHSLSDLKALSVDSYVPPGSASLARLIKIVSQPSGGNFYVLTTQLPGAVGEWTPFDALNTQVDFTWNEYADSNPNVSIANGVDTYKHFYSPQGQGHGLLLSTFGIAATNCGATKQTIALDDLVFGLNSATTTVNFEAPVATKLVGHVSKRLVGYHKPVTPTANLTTGGHGFGGQTVSLWRKRAGAHKYRKIGALVSGPGGAVIGPVQHPRVNTAYQWRYAGDKTTHSPSESTPNHVSVRSKVRLALERKTVPNGDRVAGGGAVIPRHAHLKITLWAEKVTGAGSHQTVGAPVKVGTTTLRRDGTYAVSGKLGPGHYEVFTTTAADKKNAAGRSHSRSFTVRP